MSNISDIYDGFHTSISALLTNYTRLPNPYDPNLNFNLSIEKGYGVGFSGAVNTERNLSCRLSVSRTFNIVLINQINAFDSNAVGLGVIEKSLFEDQFIIIKNLEKDTTINETLNTVKYTGDGGIEFIQQADNASARYYLLESTFEAEYFENL